MLPPDEAQQLFHVALTEFAPDWELASDFTRVTTRDADHWLSGIGTFGVALRERRTGATKILGRRPSGQPSPIAHHRGISHLVLEAYADRNPDPVRRYLQDIGLVPLRRARAS